MPTYDYECKKCDKIFEVFQSITAEKLKICPECGSEVKRLLGTGSGVVFKGTGWYVTDFKSKSGGKTDPSKTTSIPTPPAGKESAPAAKETKDSKPSKDSTPKKTSKD